MIKYGGGNSKTIFPFLSSKHFVSSRLKHKSSMEYLTVSLQGDAMTFFSQACNVLSQL